MAQVLTFSQLLDTSYKTMKPLLKTYILGALLLLVIAMVLRGIGSALFAVLEMPGIENNILLLITVFCVGLAFIIAGAIAQIVQSLYALIIAVEGAKTVKEGIRKTWKSLWKLILGGLWMMVRSYMWIMILGIPFIVLGIEYSYVFLMVIGWSLFAAGAVCAFYFMPLLAFTNIIQLQDGKGPRASAALSIERTHGYWGKIFGNNLLMAICMMLMSAAAVAVLALIGFTVIAVVRVVPVILGIIMGVPLALVLIIAITIYFFALTLFARVYMVVLYETIKANPRLKKV